MGRKKVQSTTCEAASADGRPCFDGVESVALSLNSEAGKKQYPQEIRLCVHHKKELLELGVIQFFNRYPFALKEDFSRWVQPEPLTDRHMSYLPPEALEGVVNTLHSPSYATGGYGTVPGYEDLREVRINLEAIALTDKQLMAVSLVYYGGVKKNRAAKAMNISAQALSDHVKAALKKIKAEICRM